MKPVFHTQVPISDFIRHAIFLRRDIRREKGVVLLIALIVLVAMTLAGIGLVRSVDTGNMVAGNMAFKQGATLAADAGTERAIDWLNANNGGDTLYTSRVNDGYHATSQTTLDVTNTRVSETNMAVDWEGKSCEALGVSGANCIKPSASVTVGDNAVSYIIQRLCLVAEDPNSATNSCVTYQAKDSTSAKRGELKYGEDKRFATLPGPYYRVVTRVGGPRNTVSFVETMVHF
jgi:type IV pilus assembly protein PilX